MRIETKRLRLRPLEMDDLDDLVALHAEPEVARFVNPLPRERAIERLTVAEQEWAERGHGLMAILDGETGAFLGRAGLRYWPQFEETELGWVLHRRAWGHGYATEAATACARWGFETLRPPYLTALIRPDNARSIRVAQRLGMRPLRDDVLFETPVVVYGLQRSASEEAASSLRDS